MSSLMASHQKLTNDQQRAIIEADPLTTTRETAKELSADHSTFMAGSGGGGRKAKAALAAELWRLGLKS